MEQGNWEAIRGELQKSVGKNNYTNWIEPLEFSELSDGVATFLVPTQFMGNWVSRNFGDKILHQLSAAGAPVTRVAFSVPQQGKPSKRPAALKPKVLNEDNDLPGAPLDPRCTFDTCFVGKPNELAHAAGQRVSEG